MNKESIEEAAEDFANNSAVTNYEEGINVGKYQGFIKGAKWQQERSYSEDEVLQLLRESHFVEQNIEEWFNQNKK